MGMSASQARLLSITARINDIEYKSQNISNAKIRLADESEQVARDYTNALNKSKLTFTTFENTGMPQRYDLNSANLKGALADKFRLVSADGKQVVYTEGEAKLPNGQPDPTKVYINKFSESQLYEMIESGEFRLQAYQKDEQGNEGFFDTSVSSNNQLAIESDQSQLAREEAEYNAKTMKINRKEKLLDNDLKSLDTEHNALKTEFDSVKSLIGDNVSKSFNLFS